MIRIDLKVTAVDTLDIESLLLAKNQLKIIDDGYQELKVETPEWILDRLSEISTEVSLRVRAERMKRLRTAKARRSALRTADEKRTALDAEIKELEAELA
jgi:hypothetical protein